MIIKNPYNVIAKHYKLINALLLVPMIYLLLKYQDIARFFRDFVSSNYKNYETDLGSTYVTTLCMVTTSFMIIYNAIMYLVFISKKKNGLFYLASSVIYIIILILSLLFHGTMESISNIEPTFANFVRDMANLAVLPQYVLIVVTFINAIGFNIKTLRFDKKFDLGTEEDEEEIEIKLGNDDNSAKKSIVHLIRELKYYILENKFVFSIIGIVLGIAAVGAIYVNLRITNRVYSYNQSVTAESFEIALKESYISNVDYHGDVIAKDKYFLVIKMGLMNKGEDTPIDKSVFRIVLGDKVFYPSYDRAERFTDIGKPYSGQIVRYKEQDDFVFVYELQAKEVKGTYQLRILNKLKQEEGKLNTSYKTINVKPKNLTKGVDLGTVSTSKEINLKETTLGNTTFQIKKFDVRQNYNYEYDICNGKDPCSRGKFNIIPSPGYALVIIEDSISFDEKTSYFKNTKKDFYGDFVTLRYKPAKITAEERQEINAKMKDVTPSTLKGVKAYEVPLEVLNAEKIKMLVRVRNWRFTITVRE